MIRVATTTSGATSGLGLRERRKLERRTRIQRAAREIFEKVGFEATTMRDVAARAKVGLGTLFRYAEDKSDLLMAILGDDLDEITRKSLAEIDFDGDLVTELVKIYRVRFAYWATVPDPSNYTRLEAQSERYIRRHGELTAGITRLVERQQALGRIRKDCSPDVIVRMFVTMYLGEMRLRINPQGVSVKSDIARLTKSFTLAAEGLRAPRTPVRRRSS
jgi:AcrR family transcriptional regulator